VWWEETKCHLKAKSNRPWFLQNANFWTFGWLHIHSWPLNFDEFFKSIGLKPFKDFPCLYLFITKRGIFLPKNKMLIKCEFSINLKILNTWGQGVLWGTFFLNQCWKFHSYHGTITKLKMHCSKGWWKIMFLLTIWGRWVQVHQFEL
jgi:hypothetical protein